MWSKCQYVKENTFRSFAIDLAMSKIPHEYPCQKERGENWLLLFYKDLPAGMEAQSF